MPVTTLVVQSWPDGVGPAWIEPCLASVRGWAAASGMAYRRLGDALFDPLPGWAVGAGAGARMALTDYARLLWIARLLEEAERVVWLDADILIFAPAAMSLPPGDALIRERWTWIEDGRVHGDERAGNAAMVFARGSTLLAWYLAACGTILRDAPKPLNRTALGPQVLTARHRARPVPLIERIATLSPALMDDVLAGGGAALADHAAHWPTPIAAAHLCRSLSRTPDAPDLIGEGVQARVVARLLERRTLT